MKNFSLNEYRINPRETATVESGYSKRKTVCSTREYTCKVEVIRPSKPGFCFKFGERWKVSVQQSRQIDISVKIMAKKAVFENF